MSSQSPTDHLPRHPLPRRMEPGRGLTREETTHRNSFAASRDDARLWNSWVESVSKLASDMRAAPGPALAGCMADVTRSAYWRPAAARRDGGQGLDLNRSARD